MLKNQRGIAMIEIIPILVLFVLLLNFAMGMFGVIHSGILNSIAGRNYAFETFRNRADLNYMRDFDVELPAVPFRKVGQRWHGIVDSNVDSEFFATQRPIRFVQRKGAKEPAGSQDDHNTKVRSLQDSGRVSEQGFGGAGSGGENGVDPVMIMTLYGICLNAACAP